MTGIISLYNVTEPLCCLLYEFKLNLGIRDDSQGPKFCISEEVSGLGAGEWLRGEMMESFHSARVGLLGSDLLLTPPFPLLPQLCFKGTLAKDIFSSICP